MFMGCKTAQNDVVTGPIIKAHPDIFHESDDVANEWEQLTLTLFIYSELTKGKDGYWWPYLRLMPEVEFTSSWNQHDIEMFQDEELSFELL